jgi:hypothetical protein
MSRPIQVGDYARLFANIDHQRSLTDPNYPSRQDIINHNVASETVVQIKSIRGTDLWYDLYGHLELDVLHPSSNIPNKNWGWYYDWAYNNSSWDPIFVIFSQQPE